MAGPYKRPPAKRDQSVRPVGKEPSPIVFKRGQGSRPGGASSSRPEDLATRTPPREQFAARPNARAMERANANANFKRAPSPPGANAGVKTSRPIAKASRQGTASTTLKAFPRKAGSLPKPPPPRR